MSDSASATYGVPTICLRLTPRQYANFVSNALRAATFPEVKRDVETVLRDQVNADYALTFVTACLEDIIHPETTVGKPPNACLTAHIFLAQAEALIQADSELDIPRERAGQLVAACCLQILRLKATPEAAAAKQCIRLIMRLVAAYCLEQHHVPGDHLQELLAFLLGPQKSLKAAADLLLQFPQLLRLLSLQELFAQLAAESLCSSGEQIADQADANVKAAWVQQCVSDSNHKAAVLAVRRWGLQSQLPDLEFQWIQSAFASRLAAGNWGSAGLLALEDRDMQVVLVQHLTDARELTLATDFCFQFALRPDLFPGLPQPLPAEVQAAEAARHLPLPLPPEAVILVDTAAKLHAAHAALMQAEAVGVDVECAAARIQIAGGRTSHLGVKTAMQPALLQVAMQDQGMMDLRQAWSQNAPQAAEFPVQSAAQQADPCQTYSP
ncbi:hypothetical protein WJX73_007487 [Symbiochloris irregularis]|uniref:Uncharacterized protein n=1 Tax=Symbiochloris irregularis TaxID=706552 RepID=A0AAW1P7N9_9CHLO